MVCCNVLINAMKCLGKHDRYLGMTARTLDTMRRYIFAALAALLFHLAISDDGEGRAEEQQSWQVRAVSDRGVLTLADGRQLCLGNIWLGGESRSKRQRAALKEVLGALTDGQTLRIDQGDPSTFDRYGCLMANIETDDGITLQQALLERGLAMVQPSLASTLPHHVDDWLAVEAKARQAGLGLWQDQRFKPKKAMAMAQHIGKISLVEGHVVRVSNNDRYMYLNFGQDWRTDFTVRVRNKLLKQDGIGPADFDGKRLRVRGFVQEARGPLIDISHLKQIEVMP